MSNVDDIVSITNTISDVSPTRPSFGVPLFIGYTTAFTDTYTKLYGDATEMTDAGFAVDDALYLAAVAAWNQNPAPSKIMIGRRAAALTQTLSYTPTVTREGYKYSCTIAGHAVTHTNGAAETATTIATALQTAIDALTEVSATDLTGSFSVTNITPGTMVAFDMDPALTQIDNTADTTTDDTLAAIDTELDGQSTQYYGATVVDSLSKATALLLAAALESKTALGVAQSPDDACGDPASTTDVMYALKAAAYTRTGVFYHRLAGGTEWLACAMLGEALPIDPGQQTWAFKTLAGITRDTLKAAFKTAIDGKNGNVYVESHGVNITFEGKAASGRYFDSTRFIDWENSTIDFDVFDLLQGSPKVPYTQRGLSQVGGIIAIALQKGVAADGIDGVDDPPTVTIPALADEATSDRASRIARGFKYRYRLSGALHSVVVEGTIVV